MSYRPVIDSNTASTIDAKALNGAIKSIGGWMGQGKLVPKTDPTTGQTTWSTTGGNFWDMVNGNQAQNLNNMNAMGLNQGWMDRTNLSRGRIQSAQDESTVGSMKDASLNADRYSPNPFTAGRATATLNSLNEELAKQEAVKEAIRKGLLQNQIESGMPMPGMQLRHLGLQNSGLQQQQNQADMLFPMSLAQGQANLDTHMKNLGWIDQLNQAKIDESKAQADHWRSAGAMQRLQNLGHGFVLDPMTGTVTQAYQETPLPGSSVGGYTNYVGTTARAIPGVGFAPRLGMTAGGTNVMHPFLSTGGNNQFNAPIEAPKMSLSTNAPTQTSSPAMINELLEVIRKHKKAN